MKKRKGAEQHSLITKEIMAYLFGLLEAKERGKFESHLNSCPACRENMKKAVRIKKAIENEPFLKAPYCLEDILKKARELEQKQAARGLSRLYGIVRFWKLVRQSMVVRAGLGLAGLAVLIMIIGFPAGDRDRLYVLKSSGDVLINNRSLYESADTAHNLDKPLHVALGDGECVLQINKDKLLLLQAGTEVTILSGKDIRVLVKKGDFLGKVERKKEDKEMMVVTDQASFRIAGTVFYIKAQKDFVECGVEKGEVESILKKESYIIRDWEKIRVRSGRAEHLVRISKDDASLKRLKRALRFQEPETGYNGSFFPCRRDMLTSYN